jgi:hypothetical protein
MTYYPSEGTGPGASFWLHFVLDFRFFFAYARGVGEGT